MGRPKSKILAAEKFNFYFVCMQLIVDFVEFFFIFNKKSHMMQTDILVFIKCFRCFFIFPFLIFPLFIFHR